MTKRTLRFGVLVGLTGGGLMALFAMITMGLLGRGFLTPINLFAHAFWNGAPIDGTFTLASFELGLLIHLMISIGIGTLIAYIVETGQLDAGVIFLLAMGVGGGAWITQAIVWPAVDSDAHAAFTPWVLAVAHLMFALGAALFLTRFDHGSTEPAEKATIPADGPATPFEHVAIPRPTRSGFSRSLSGGQPTRHRESLGIGPRDIVSDEGAPVVTEPDVAIRPD